MQKNLIVALAIAMGLPSFAFANEAQLTPSSVTEAAQKAAEITDNNAADQAIDLRIPDERPILKSGWFWTGVGIALAGAGVTTGGLVLGPQGVHEAGSCLTRECAQAGVDKARNADNMLIVGLAGVGTGVVTAIIVAAVNHSHNVFVAQQRARRLAKMERSPK